MNQPDLEVVPMRVTTAFKHLLRLPGVNVTGVVFQSNRVIVTVALRRRRLACPLCDHSTRARYDLRDVDSRWRHLDLGAWRLEVRARLRRLRCPDHGVRVECVPFARHRSEFTRDFEDLVAWLAAKTDKSAIERLLRIAWRTVGAIVERVVSDELDPERLNDLFEIGIDEISWRKQHNYLTLVSNHRSGKVVWGAEGKDTKTCDSFFDELGKERSSKLTAVSMDMGKAYLKSVTKQDHAPQATICIDPFHVVALATKALDDVRRDVWNDMRALDSKAAKKFKDARWSLMKNPDNLTDKQAATLRRLKRRGGDLWRAYRLKESCRAIFSGDLDPDEVEELLDRLISQAQRSRLEPFVKLSRTLRDNRDGILAAIRLGINNGRAEGLNNVVRLIARRAYGFHSATAAVALVMLCCGPITLRLPYQGLL
ncbi:MAG: ISL3 family transposase [Actinobacteria bacterium]|nr:ISL3 family transposase [Actinomycetota bacterium]